eukprot:8481481-Pyramimonas_sp.AAC.1
MSSDAPRVSNLSKLISPHAPNIRSVASGQLRKSGAHLRISSPAAVSASAVTPQLAIVVLLS